MQEINNSASSATVNGNATAKRVFDPCWEGWLDNQVIHTQRWAYDNIDSHRTMTATPQQQDTLRYSREHGYHTDPRTKDPVPCVVDRNRRMPNSNRNHLNACPKVAYHREVNTPQGMTSRGLVKGQQPKSYATVWQDRKHGYVPLRALKAAEAPRLAVVQAPAQRKMRRKWRH
jgi:hypothetical protein